MLTEDEMMGMSLPNSHFALDRIVNTRYYCGQVYITYFLKNMEVIKSYENYEGKEGKL